MRRLHLIVLIVALAPWAFLAFGETPKKPKTAAKKPAKAVDLASLSEPERRALLQKKFADDRRNKEEEKEKGERAAALKAATKLEAQLKSAATDAKPALLYELGVTHFRVNNIAPARRYFQQAAESPGEWAERAKIHLFDIALCEERSLEDAGRVVHVGDPPPRNSVAEAVFLPGTLLRPRQVADKPLALDAVAANLAARRALLDFLAGKPQSFALTGAGNGFWSALAKWEPQFPEVLDEPSDAAWLARLCELHFAAKDHKTVISLAGAVTPYVDGKIHGRRRRWGHFEGTMRNGCNVTTFERGKMNGWSFVLDDDGTLLEYSYIKQDQLHGVMRKTTRDGKNVRGYPSYRIQGKEVTEEQFRHAAKTDKILAMTLTGKPDVEESEHLQKPTKQEGK